METRKTLIKALCAAPLITAFAANALGNKGIVEEKPLPTSFISELPEGLKWQCTFNEQTLELKGESGSVNAAITFTDTNPELSVKNQLGINNIKSTESIVHSNIPGLKATGADTENNELLAYAFPYREGSLILSASGSADAMKEQAANIQKILAGITLKEKAESGELKASRIEDTIVIDGKLDENDWQKTQQSRNFCAPHNPFTPDLANNPAYKTTIRILWDEDYLYFGFVCNAPEIFADRTEHDEKLYQQDVAEAFLDMTGEALHIAEYHFSPLATLGDAYTTWERSPNYPSSQIQWNQSKAFKRNLSPDWDPEGTEAASSKIMDGDKLVAWVIEAKVPVAELRKNVGLPEDLSQGDIIYANFMRYIQYKDPDHPKAKNGRVHRQLNWRATKKGCPHVTPMAMRPFELAK